MLFNNVTSSSNSSLLCYINKCLQRLYVTYVFPNNKYYPQLYIVIRLFLPFWAFTNIKNWVLNNKVMYCRCLQNENSYSTVAGVEGGAIRLLPVGANRCRPPVISYRFQRQGLGNCRCNNGENGNGHLQCPIVCKGLKEIQFYGLWNNFFISLTDTGLHLGIL